MNKEGRLNKKQGANAEEEENGTGDIKEGESPA